MKRLLFILVIVVLALPFGMAHAEDPAVGSKEDNACNAGGSMAGQCTTEWHWVCGYYLARFNTGVFSRVQVPAACGSLLATIPVDASGTVILCLSNPGIYVDAAVESFEGGSHIVPIYYFLSSDGTCSGSSIITAVGFYTATGGDVLPTCGFVTPATTYYPNAPSNLFYC